MESRFCELVGEGDIPQWPVVGCRLSVGLAGGWWLGGIMHCFGGGWEQASRSLELGFLVSFAGNLTYPKAQALREVAARLPLDGVLVETDAPWLAPAAQRGKRNEPAWVVQTASVLAGLLGVEEEEIAAATKKNFNRLFGFGGI